MTVTQWSIDRYKQEIPGNNKGNTSWYIGNSIESQQWSHDTGTGITKDVMIPSLSLQKISWYQHWHSKRGHDTISGITKNVMMLILKWHKMSWYHHWNYITMSWYCHWITKISRYLTDITKDAMILNWGNKIYQNTLNDVTKDVMIYVKGYQKM